MHTRRFAALTVLLILGSGMSAQAGPPKAIVAVFSQKDPGFTETITLYADGRYEQKETQSEAAPYRLGSGRHQVLPVPDFPAGFGDFTRSGAWHLLDKEGGVPVAYKPGASFPSTAVIELKSAMPFGFVWANQSPRFLHGDRFLAANFFQVVKPAAPPAHTGILTLGSPLPPLVKP